MVERDEKELTIPVELPTNGQDWANYISHYRSSNSQIGIVLEFEKKLDIHRMQKAIRLSIDAEPVLGCRFVEHPFRPFWERLEKIDDLEWCLLEQTENGEERLEKFLIEPLEPKTRQLQAMIIRSGEKDVLCLKLSHACSDGGGAKDYLAILADIYCRLMEDEHYLPKPNKSGIRDSSNLWKALGMTDPKQAWNPQLAALKPTWAFPHRGNKENPPSVKSRLSMRRLDGRQFTELCTFAKEQNGTINDLILTAYYRAMFAMANPESSEPMEICVSVDLRRYLPDQQAKSVCNLSGLMNVRLPRVEKETFAETLGRVKSLMKELKKSHPGIHSAASMMFMETMGFQKAVGILQAATDQAFNSGKSSPLLSNVGIMAQYPLLFGENRVMDAYLVTPAFHSPSFMLGVSTYNQILTLTVSYFDLETQREAVDEFLDRVQRDLVKAE